MSNIFRKFALLLCLIFPFTPGFAQSAYRITICDQRGAPVKGANISIQTPSEQIAITTDDSGTFELPHLSSKAVISATNFKSRTLTFQAGTPPPPVITLDLAEISNSVDINASSDYRTSTSSSSTRTALELRDTPQSLTVISVDQMRDQSFLSIGDAVRYVPGLSVHQGENNRDQLIFRGNNSSADFFINGIRDDVQYYRDLYNLERIEILRGSNALSFGRGGGGGVLNRITKEAGPSPFMDLQFSAGSFGGKRAALDFNRPFGTRTSFRLNSMYEYNESFRDYVTLSRYGVAPTISLQPGRSTRLTLSFEHFHDSRVADRGISSFQARPLNIPVATYFGNPYDSKVRAMADLGSVYLEHQHSRILFRSRSQIGAYDKFYQNYVPGVVSADKAKVAISAYNNSTQRLNILNQTDASFTVTTGFIRHQLIGGFELGLQQTDNLRNTGYFNNSSVSIQTLLSNTAISTPISFRQSATDADNHVRTSTGSLFVQDQLSLNRYVSAIIGLRGDRFDLIYQNKRNGDLLSRTDNKLSPRAALVIKPLATLSAYASYSVSFLPSSGDQFSSLTTITQQLKPEQFTNYEIGAKWDVRRTVSLTAALYRLDRTNTRATDPNDPTRIIQTGSQRTNGFEFSANGSLGSRWRLTGGYAFQDAFIASATTAAPTGARVAQVPHHQASLWNNFQVTSRLSLGLGAIQRSQIFAAIDNTVVLDGYLRFDGAAFYQVSDRMRLQVNVENLGNHRYFANADNNTNISPGAPRSLRGAVSYRF